MSDPQGSLETIVLVGAPNSGKTTLYNWLTGAHAKAVNYPGSTVDYLKGHLASHWRLKAQVIDTPGTYSLQPKTEDEAVTRKILMDPEFPHHPDRVVVVVDGTQLARHLMLAEQIKSLGIPMILVVTMVDLLRSKGLKLDIEPLKDHFKCPVLPVEGRLGGGLKELVREFAKPPQPTGANTYAAWSELEYDRKSRETQSLVERVLPASADKVTALWNQTLNWDRLLLHPFWGLVFFVLVMSLLFSSIYWLATPLMDIVDSIFASGAEALLALSPDSLWMDFVANGLVASFGSVLVFVPQIFILFLGMSALEGSGYLARAATLIDKPFSVLGLSGRSFVPFLSGYACAVPALMAARNINSQRERWIARMIIPLLSCSARLPVYGLLLGFLFWGESAWKPGLALAGIYLFSMVMSAIAAGILHRLIPRDRRSFFLMELPLYRRPVFRSLVYQAWLKTRSFIFRAGPVIFTLTVILWVGITFPHYQAEETVKVQTSYLGQVGQKIEPLFEPMGLDWRGGIGLLAAFAAREVFVSTLAVVYSVSEESGDSGLIAAMQNATFQDGRPIFTTAVVWGLVVFFMIALQCLSTVATMIKESGSIKLALFQLLILNVIGYGLAVALVQGLRALGIP